MEKRIINLATALALTLTASATAHAGGDIGNGGMGVVCRNPNGKVTYARLLDLYEAENDPTLGWSIPSREEATEVQLRSVGYRLPAPAETDLLYFYNFIRNRVRPTVNPDVGPATPDDFHPRVTLKRARKPSTANCLSRAFGQTRRASTTPPRRSCA